MILETKNLTKSFGLRKAVYSLDLEIPTGAVYGFLGPNGSGKSTTMAALIQKISKTSNKHIITIEDPIEYLFYSMSRKHNIQLSQFLII